MLLHNLEELDDDLGARADQDLTLAALLGVVDVVKSIVEDGSADHLGGIGAEILKSGMDCEVSAIGKREQKSLAFLSRPWELRRVPSITKVLPAQLPKGRSVSLTSAPSLIALPGLRKRHDPVVSFRSFSLGDSPQTYLYGLASAWN